MQTVAGRLVVGLLVLVWQGCGTNPGAGTCPAGEVFSEAGCVPNAVVTDDSGFGGGGGDAEEDGATFDTGASSDVSQDPGSLPMDTALSDVGSLDAGPADVAPSDVDPAEDTSTDADPVDAGSPDVEPVDVGPSDGGVDVPVCVPNCDGRTCGPDGCGDVCGVCADDEACSSTGVCEPVDRPAGEATCLDVAECVFDCDDAGCAAACVAEGTLEAQDEFADLIACGDTNCDGPVGSEDWLDCVDDACGVAESCFGGTPVEPGCSPDDAGTASSLGDRDANDALDCGFDCLDELGEDVCARECTAEVLGIAESCAVCTGELVLCAADECAGECSGRGGYDRDCRGCLRDEGCAGDFDTCLADAAPAP
jgi:hypothetical protein